MTRSIRYRSWLTTMSVPGQESSRSSSADQGVGVQVVGRLVEDQHVRLGHQDPQQLQPPTLAAGELRHPGPLVLVGEAEPFGQLAGRDVLAAQIHRAGDLGDCLEQPQLGRQLDDVLRQIPDAGPSCPASPSREVTGRSPTSTRSSVDFPEPLIPTRPIRSPGPTARSRRPAAPGPAGRRDGRGHTLQVEHVLAQPLRGRRLCSSTVFRGSGTSAISASAASMR